jgi:capsid protein
MSRLRDAWNALRGYAAAQDQRASAWAPSGGSATSEVGMAAKTVALRARNAVRNDPYASSIVDLWTGNAVGAGITGGQHGPRAALPADGVAIPAPDAGSRGRAPC